MKRMLRFLVPSLVGAAFFLIPIRYDGGYTILVGIAADLLSDRFSSLWPSIATGLALVSALLTAWFSVISKPAAGAIRWYVLPFIASRRWLALRVLGFLTSAMVFWQAGPEFIWSDATGRVMLFDLAPTIIAIFIFASFLLPLLTDFGLMELIGSLLSRSFRRLFTLPGRSSMDALASWMAAAAVGVILTSQQFDRGYYSAREAACIATNFSIVSLPFCVVIADFAGLGHLFLPFYLTVCVIGFVTAMILPRIPPLSAVPDEYSAAGRQAPPDPDPGENLWQQGLAAAVARADTAPGVRAWLRAGLSNLSEILFGLLPPVIAVGTFGLIVIEYTPVFDVLSTPFVYLLGWLAVPEAQAAAPALLVGFVDMFLPAVLAQDIDSPLTRFVIIVVSISQLVYLTEVGVLILRSSIPLTFARLLVIFLLRTLIALPLAVASARFVVFA